jgi:hypothetical protein
MGHVHHHAILITFYDRAGSGLLADVVCQLDDLREELPQNFRPLLIGPIPSAANFDYSVAFLPDGSKEGWDTSNEGDKIRKRLIDMFSDWADVIEVCYGGDSPECARITYNDWTDNESE